MLYWGKWTQVSSHWSSKTVQRVSQNYAAQTTGSCRGCCWPVPVFLLSEDWNPRWLKDCDLHQSAVGLDRFAVVKGNHKQLPGTREYTGDKRPPPKKTNKLTWQLFGCLVSKQMLHKYCLFQGSQWSFQRCPTSKERLVRKDLAGCLQSSQRACTHVLIYTERLGRVGTVRKRGGATKSNSQIFGIKDKGNTHF